MKPVNTQTLPELIKTIRSVASRLHYFSDLIVSDRFKLDMATSYMQELEEAIDILNTRHSHLMESCAFGDMVKVGELEMQKEHYDRYMEVRSRIENLGRKQMPIVV
jgi:hypothetical protein